jgi:Tol biopolymer transport system component
LLPGDVAQVANLQLPLRVRQEIGLEALVLGLARQSNQVVIQEGPQCADDLAWYRVRTQFGLEGWVAEGDDQDYFLNQISQESLVTDGFNLAYESNGTVFLFNESRGTTQTLMQMDQGISTPPEWSWSPDGRSLLFFKLMDEKIAGFVYDLQSGQERRLTDHFGFVSWHPGGEVIAFSDNTNYKLINLSDGSEVFRVFVRAAYESSFSPDGSQLAVAVYTGSQYELHALDVSRDSFSAWTLEPLSTQTLLDAGNVYYNLRWSPSGDKIGYVQSDGSEFGSRLKVMDLEANRVEDISPGDGQVYQQVVWAPDGDRLAFLALTPEQPGQPFRFEVYLSTTRRGGFQAKVFDFQDVTVTTPSWAPDGSRLVFTIFSDTLPPSLYLANSDGSYATPFILSDSQAYNAQFQP